MRKKKVWAGPGPPGQSLGWSQGLPASPWPGQVQALHTHGGCDSGRLSLSVRTWLAEAATAADLKGASRGAKPPQEKVCFFVIVQKVPGMRFDSSWGVLAP